MKGKGGLLNIGYRALPLVRSVEITGWGEVSTGTMGNVHPELTICYTTRTNARSA